jgi:hypothetical protein
VGVALVESAGSGSAQFGAGSAEQDLDGCRLDFVVEVAAEDQRPVGAVSVEELVEDRGGLWGVEQDEQAGDAVFRLRGGLVQQQAGVFPAGLGVDGRGGATPMWLGFDAVPLRAAACLLAGPVLATRLSAESARRPTAACSRAGMRGCAVMRSCSEGVGAEGSYRLSSCPRRSRWWHRLATLVSAGCGARGSQQSPGYLETWAPDEVDLTSMLDDYGSDEEHQD